MLSGVPRAKATVPCPPCPQTHGLGQGWWWAAGHGGGCRPVWLSSSQLCVQKLRILIEDSDQNCKSLPASLALMPECHAWDSEISCLGDQMVLGPLPSAVLMPVQLGGRLCGWSGSTYAGRDLVLNSKSRVPLTVWLASPAAALCPHTVLCLNLLQIGGCVSVTCFLPDQVAGCCLPCSSSYFRARPDRLSHSPGSHPHLTQQCLSGSRLHAGGSFSEPPVDGDTSESSGAQVSSVAPTAASLHFS